MSLRLSRRGIPPVVSGDFFTAFPATENPLSLGGICKNGLTDGLDWNNMQSTPGICWGTADTPDPGPFTDNIMTYQGVFSPTKHYATAKVRRDAGYNPVGLSHELGLVVGATIAAHSAKEYSFNFSIGNSSIVYGRWNGPSGSFYLGTFTVVSGTDFYAGGAQDNDIMKAIYDSTSGNVVLSLFINDMVTPYLVVRDNNDDLGKHMTGNPGLSQFTRPGAAMDRTKYCWREFGCGNA